MKFKVKQVITTKVFSDGVPIACDICMDTTCAYCELIEQKLKALS